MSAARVQPFLPRPWRTWNSGDRAGKQPYRHKAGADRHEARNDMPGRVAPIRSRLARIAVEALTGCDV